MTRILIVDDSSSIRMHLSQVLGKAGYAVVQAIDGVDALTKLEPCPDVVLCDVNMPGMDGLEFLEHLRRDPRWRRLPVLMLTTEGDPALIARARQHGASGWIVKPFESTALLGALSKLVGPAGADAVR